MRAGFARVTVRDISYNRVSTSYPLQNEIHNFTAVLHQICAFNN